MEPFGLPDRRSGSSPFVQHAPFDLIQLLQLLGAGGDGGQLNPVAIGVKQVNGLDDSVVRGTQYIDSRFLQAVPGVHEFLDRTKLKSDMLNPFGSVSITIHGRGIGEFKKGKDVSLAGIQKYMHVRIRLFGRWNPILGNGQQKLHIQKSGVKINGFASVLAAIRHVMNFLDIYGHFVHRFS